MPQRVAVSEPRHAPAPLDRTMLPTPARGALHGAGRPIEAGLRRRMEAGFGVDFASVRIHDDAAATLGLIEMRALGLAAGEHVALPGRTDDDRVLAHELTHVVQARAAAAGATRPGGDPEREAETAAAAVLRGDAAPPIAAAPGGSVQLLTALNPAMVTAGLKSGALVDQYFDYFSYVAAWWRAGGTPGGTPPAGFLEGNGTIALYDPGAGGVGIEHIPTSPASQDELRLARMNYEAARRLDPSLANELPRIEQAVQQARVQTAQGIKPPPPSGPGPKASGGPAAGPAASQAATEPELPATPEPAAPARGAATQPQGGRLARLTQGARGLAKQGAARVTEGARSLGRATMRGVGRILGPLGVVAQVLTVVEAVRFLGVDPRTLPQGAPFVDPGSFTGLVGRAGTVHHRPDGVTELRFPKILLPMPQPETTIVISNADTA